MREGLLRLNSLLKNTMSNEDNLGKIEVYTLNKRLF